MPHQADDHVLLLAKILPSGKVTLRGESIALSTATSETPSILVTRWCTRFHPHPLA